MTNSSLNPPEPKGHRIQQIPGLSQLEDPFGEDHKYTYRSEFNGSLRRESTGSQEPKPSRRHDVRTLKDEILKSRLSLRELRTDLGQQRARIREMQITLWKELQRYLSSPSELNAAATDELFESITRALDLIGPSEEDYNEKEDELNVLELQLEGLEGDNDGSSASPESFARPGLFQSHSVGQNSVATVRTEGSKKDKDNDSPMQQYLSRLGDARIIQERLYELWSEKVQYLDIQRDRDALGHPQYQPNIDFLADFDRVYNEEFEQLRTVEIEVASLARKAGIEPPLTGEMHNDLTHPDNSQTEITNSFPQIAAISANHPSTPRLTNSPIQNRALSDTLIATDRTTTSQLTFSPVQTRALSDTLIVTYRTATSRLTTSPIQTGDLSDTSIARRRINDWILNILQLSPLERARHKAMLGDPNLDDAEWSRLIRKYWQRDQGISDHESSWQPNSHKLPRFSMSPRIQSSEGFVGEAESIFDKSMHVIEGQIRDQISYNTESFPFGASRLDSSPSPASSLSSISHASEDSESLSTAGSWTRNRKVSTDMDQTSTANAAGFEDPRNGGDPHKDVLVGDNYRLTIDSDPESLVEDDCFFRETEGGFESVIHRFRHIYNPADFFVIGKVFKLLRWETREATRAFPKHRDDGVALGNEALAKVYRFVVVKSNSKGDSLESNSPTSSGYSMCLRISTHSPPIENRNSIQNGLAMIYIGRKAPKRQPDERNIMKELRVQAMDKSQWPNPSSRVNLTKTYLVDHSVKVCEIGKVAKRDIKKLVEYWQNERSREFSRSN